MSGMSSTGAQVQETGFVAPVCVLKVWDVAPSNSLACFVGYTHREVPCEEKRGASGGRSCKRALKEASGCASVRA